MENSNNWFDKRMEDIPMPIIVGDANLTTEVIQKGEDDLRRLMKESGVLTDIE